MAEPLTDAEAPRVLAEIHRLYHLLERLPYKARPDPGAGYRASPAYTAIEIEIKALSDRYRAWEATQPAAKCRMAKAGLRRRA